MKSLKIGDVEFVLDIRAGPDRGKSTEDRFILVKSQKMLDLYQNWRFPHPKTIMEIGLFEGGSLVFLDKIFEPEKLVGLDIRADPIEPLQRYAETRDHIELYFGRSQDKPGTLAAARKNFSGGIDLIVDDASHLYPQTRATFEMLFPLVKKGGVYLIEDWAWSHRSARQSDDAVWADRPALTNLVFELVVMASSYGAVAEVQVASDYVAIVRGPGRLPQHPFDFSKLLRGREMPLL